MSYAAVIRGGIVVSSLDHFLWTCSEDKLPVIAALPFLSVQCARASQFKYCSRNPVLRMKALAHRRTQSCLSSYFHITDRAPAIGLLYLTIFADVAKLSNDRLKRRHLRF